MLLGQIVSVAAAAIALQVALPAVWPGFQLVGADTSFTSSSDGPPTRSSSARPLIVAHHRGQRASAWAVMAIINDVGVTCELVGVVALVALLFAHAKRGPAVVVHTSGVAGHGSYLWPFLVSALMACYVMYGFDSAGELSEETRDPAPDRPPGHPAGAGRLRARRRAAAARRPPRRRPLTDPNLGTGGLPYVITDRLGSGLGKVLLVDVSVAVCVVHPGHPDRRLADDVLYGPGRGAPRQQVARPGLVPRRHTRAARARRRVARRRRAGGQRRPGSAVHRPRQSWRWSSSTWPTWGSRCPCSSAASGAWPERGPTDDRPFSLGRVGACRSTWLAVAVGQRSSASTPPGPVPRSTTPGPAHHWYLHYFSLLFIAVAVAVGAGGYAASRRRAHPAAVDGDRRAPVSLSPEHDLRLTASVTPTDDPFVPSTLLRDGARHRSLGCHRRGSRRPGRRRAHHRHRAPPVHRRARAGHRVIDCTGLLVTPGLIDLHAHVMAGPRRLLRRRRLASASTRACRSWSTAGTSGVATFDLRRARSSTTLDPHPGAVLHRPEPALPGHEGLHLPQAGDRQRPAQPRRGRRSPPPSARNADVIVGLKARACHVGDPTHSPFLDAAQRAAGAKPVMVHLGRFPHTPTITHRPCSTPAAAAATSSPTRSAAAAALLDVRRQGGRRELRDAVERGVRPRHRPLRHRLPLPRGPPPVRSGLPAGHDLDRPQRVQHRRARVLAGRDHDEDAGAGRRPRRRDRHGHRPTPPEPSAAPTSWARWRSGERRRSASWRCTPTGPFRSMTASRRSSSPAALAPVGCVRAGRWIAAQPPPTFATSGRTGPRPPDGPTGDGRRFGRLDAADLTTVSRCSGIRSAPWTSSTPPARGCSPSSCSAGTRRRPTRARSLRRPRSTAARTARPGCRSAGSTARRSAARTTAGGGRPTAAASRSRRCPACRSRSGSASSRIQHRGALRAGLGAPRRPGRRPCIPAMPGVGDPDHAGRRRRAVHVAGRRAAPRRELRRPGPLRLGPRRHPRPPRRAGAPDSRHGGERTASCGSPTTRRTWTPRGRGVVRGQRLPDADAADRRHRVRDRRRRGARRHLWMTASPIDMGGVPHVLDRGPRRRPRRARRAAPRVPGAGARRGRAGRAATRSPRSSRSSRPSSCPCAPTGCRSSTGAGWSSWVPRPVRRRRRSRDDEWTIRRRWRGRSVAAAGDAVGGRRLSQDRRVSRGDPGPGWPSPSSVTVPRVR